MARKWLLMHGKSPKRPKKGLGWVFAPSRHILKCWTETRNFTVFHHWTCNQNVEMCHMGAHTHPKPFFWKFSNFSKKIECFWYLDHFRVIKTRRVLRAPKSWGNQSEDRFRGDCRKTQNEQMHFFPSSLLPYHCKLYTRTKPKTKFWSEDDCFFSLN